ncbi:twin-arginine translocation signal domain-containing protein [Olsenella sp. YH-ols2217]|uniref:Twin-arginine translocation signal domain-containing protein n=1 Tax=Kribbibacterium absianum TaxID=3044210 RepID=A0ABT6ZK16_9ACTN|nr:MULTISPECIES: twin-arginine translocation signal domain-containing protein [unclassified Olsenella]MDJ1122780.1 twin-arginine translocation signal domain-containing protein [Olsenella sp. YH-ols2216]MDJ1129237.1 twin-arginine translocation signal domain-containing protein [Olsenella sp. YH-ols2217]
MSMNVNRRQFLTTAGAGVAAASVALVGCNAGSQPTADAETADQTSGFTETEMDGYVVVENPDGPQLSYSPDSGLKIIDVDGLPFKDFEGTGELVPYED